MLHEAVLGKNSHAATLGNFAFFLQFIHFWSSFPMLKVQKSHFAKKAAWRDLPKTQKMKSDHCAIFYGFHA